jgi:hypothetical protein
MEAVRTSETLVSINLTTRQYIPRDSKLYNFIVIAILFLLRLFDCAVSVIGHSPADTAHRKKELN